MPFLREKFNKTKKRLLFLHANATQKILEWKSDAHKSIVVYC